MSNTTRQYWYGEPWVWFNLVLLGLAISAATVMSIIAIYHTPAEIGSHWYQDGVLAKRERQQEVLIKKMRLEGDVGITQDGVVALNLRHDNEHVSETDINKIDVKVLQLYIEHPTNPEDDQVVTLERTAPMQYSGRLSKSISGKRRLLISPRDDAWYLVSAAYFPLQHLTFRPDLNE